MREAVEKLVRALVTQPDAVEVTETGERGLTVFQVQVAAGEVGRLIGREGRTIRALRSLLNVAGQKQGRRYGLEIVE